MCRMLPFLFSLLFFGAFLLNGLNAERGIASDKAISSEQFECVVNGKHYYQFVGRPWKSNGRPDTVGTTNMLTAKNARIPWITPVFTPCLYTSCAKPEVQTDAFVNYLSNVLGLDGGLFIEVLGISEWGSDQQLNRQRLAGFMKTFDRAHQPVIFTNKTSWEAIMGRDFTEYQENLLSILELDGNPDYSNFVPFGGWQRTFMKQYGHGPVQGCNFTADLIIYFEDSIRKDINN